MIPEAIRALGTLLFHNLFRVNSRCQFFIKGPIFLIIVYEPSFSLFIAFYMSFLRFLR